VRGRGDAASGVVDRDYFTVVVPVGQRLEGIVVGSGFRAGGGGLSFIGIEAGSQVLASPTSGGPSLLGFALVGTGDIGTSILDQLGGPLGAGTHSLWIQEIEHGSFPYEYDLQVAVIPEPGVAMVVVAAGGGLLGRRRR